MSNSSQQGNKTKKQVTPPWAHFIAGGTGGMLGAILTSPLEVIKTRLQAGYNKSSLQTQFKFGFGTINSLQILKKEEGLKGFFRGLAPHLIGVIPARAIYFFTYGTSKQLYIDQFKIPHHSFMSSFLAGITAGLVVVTTTQPIWLVKTRMQLQTSTTEVMYKTSLDAVVKMYKTEGLSVFYKGMTASYVGISEGCIQFILYDQFRHMITQQRPNDKQTSFECLLTASVAKLIASALTYPHEVIRTRLREPGNVLYKGVFSGLKLVYKMEGISGLYGGMGAHLIRVVPNAAIMFLTYELVIRSLSR